MKNYIDRKAAKLSVLSLSNIVKYQYLTGEKILLKKLEKQLKTFEDQGKKQVDAIVNQNERLVALANEDDINLSYKKYLKNLLGRDMMK